MKKKEIFFDLRAVLCSLTGFSWVFILGVLFYLCNPVFAKTTEQEISELKARLLRQEKKIAELESKLTRQESAPKSVRLEGISIEDLDKHIDSHLLHRISGYQLLEGLRMGFGATFVMQGTHNANGDRLSKNGEDITDGSYSIDVEFEREFDNKAKAFLHLETGDGTGVEDELQVFSSVNRDADDSDNSVSVTEAWWEHYFKSIPLTLTFGKIDPTVYVDNNKYANDETTQFLGHIFRNSPVVEFPDDNAFGIRFGLEPVEFLDIELTAMDANADWEDAFDNIFFSGQVNFKPNLLNSPANYRVYGWLNDKGHIKWNDTSETKEESYGFGLSFDRELTDVLGAFVRYGWQSPEIYADGSAFSFEQSWSAGIQLSGGLWGRDDDVFAIAFGQVIPSDDYKNATSIKADSEEHLEAYYSFRVNDHFTVSPDIQGVWDPYGGDAVNGDKTIFIAGLRAQLDF